MDNNYISQQNQEKLEAVANFIRELRIQNGLSQQELGDMEGVDLNRRSIGNAESGKNFTVMTLIKIVEGLGINIFDSVD